MALLVKPLYPILERITTRPQKDIVPPTCIIFLHIPKVGGRTVASFLKEIANERGFQTQGIYNKKFIDPKQIKINNTLISGHFSPAFFELNNSTKQCFKMTVLRNPIDRAISAFFFHGHKYPAEVRTCLNTTIVNTTHPRCSLKWQYSNDMTRQLSGLRDTKWNTYLENNYFSTVPTRGEFCT